MMRKEKVLLSSALFLFTAWLATITIKWDVLQTLRYSDPLWLMNALSPHIFIIIIGLVLIISMSIWAKINNIWFHTCLIVIFSSVLLCTPYLVGSVARFPDTFGVIYSVENLPEILANSTSAYAADYPLSYLLFYIVEAVTQQSMFTFSQVILSPAVIISFVTIWYLFLRRFTDPNIAFLATAIATPAILVEVSLTPNSVGMVLATSALLALMIDSRLRWALVAFFTIALVLVHPLNIIMVFTFLLSFSIVNIFVRKKVGRRKIDSPILLLPFIAIGWFVWSIFESSRGMGIIKTVIRLFNSTPSTNNPSVLGTGGISDYIWTQNVMVGCYTVFAISGIVIFLYVLAYYILILLKRRSMPIDGVFGAHNAIPYMLTSAIFFSLMTFASFLFVAGGDQIVSRSLNYAILALSVCIVVCITAVQRALVKSNKITWSKAFGIFVIGMFITVSVAYPIHGYSRDSYISYAESYELGSLFDAEHSSGVDFGTKKIFTTNAEHRAAIDSASQASVYKITKQSYLFSGDYAFIYTNKNYEIYTK